MKHNGQDYLRYEVEGGNACCAIGRVQVYDPTASELREKFPSLAKEALDYPKVPVNWHYAYQDGLSEARQRATHKLHRLEQDANSNLLDFDYLFSEFKA